MVTCIEYNLYLFEYTFICLQHDCDLKDSSQFSTQMFRVREIVNGNMRVLQVWLTYK